MILLLWTDMQKYNDTFIMNGYAKIQWHFYYELICKNTMTLLLWTDMQTISIIHKQSLNDATRDY